MDLREVCFGSVNWIYLVSGCYENGNESSRSIKC
jgi:hypothetical protein